MVSFIKVINLVIAFLLEIAMLIAFGYFGYHHPENTANKYFLMIALPLAASVVWGFFAAPKSKYRLRKIPRLVFALALFATSIFLLNTAGKTELAAVFAVLVVMNQILLFVLEQ